MFNASMKDVGGVKLRKLVFPALWVILLIWTSRAAFSHYRELSESPEAPLKLSDMDDDGQAPKPPQRYNTLFDPLYSYNAETATVNISTSEKVAVIIKTLNSGNLVPLIVPLILHFASVLGPLWPMIVYTDTPNVGSFWNSAALVRHQRTGRIILRPLPNGVSFPNWDSVSDFMVRTWIWDDLAPAEYVLVFQSDSIICANAARSVDDFFEYDLIGAPIRKDRGQGYNGGLSLRRRSTILRVLDMGHPRTLPEDQWFYAKMRELQDDDLREGIEDGINLPSEEIARTFAVETIDYPHPVGFHPTRFVHEHMLDINEWCPEYRLATGKSAYFK